MFTNDFQMNGHPFSENPPLDHLLKDQRFTQALAKLDYFTHEGSLALVTAATGLGKTSLANDNYTSPVATIRLPH
jgi:general secretion pathway protein A